VNNASAVQRFFKLAKIDSAPTEERLIADELKNELKQLGCSVYEDGAGEKINGNTGNLIATLPGTLPGTIMFCAHMDRVEQGLGIKPQIKDGIISSDGTTILAADDLAGVVAILEGVAKAKASERPHPNIEILFPVCEERGLMGSKNLDYSKVNAKFGYILDTSGRIGRIVNKAPFKGVVTIEVFGKASHAGNFPERGVNAIMAAAHILDGLQEGRLGLESTSNFGSIYGGGENIGTVCNHAVIRGEIRNHDKSKLEEYYQYVKEYCEQKIKETKATCSIKFKLDYEGFFVPVTDPMMVLLTDTMKSMNITPRIETGMGGMDANNFNAYGIKSVGVAIGYSEPHSLNERIVVEDLIKAGELVYNLIFNYHE